MHMSRCESFSRQVHDPVTDLVVTRRDKAYPLAFEGMAYGESGVAAIALMGEVWGIYDISQEEVISSFLRTQFHPIYRGKLHHQPCPRLCRPPQLMCALD